MTRIITGDMLSRAGVLSDYVKMFEHLAPTGMSVSPSTLDALRQMGFSVWWLERLLSPEKHAALHEKQKAAWLAKEEAMRPIREAHREALDLALSEALNNED